jgi:hypothetical protein
VVPLLIAVRGVSHEAAEAVPGRTAAAAVAAARTASGRLIDEFRS